MRRLVFCECKRWMVSVYMLVLLGIVIGMNGNRILIYSYGGYVSTGFFMMQNIVVMCIALAVYVALVIGSDFDYRLINHKITTGITRVQCYLAELIAGSAATLLLLVVDCVTIVIFCRYRGYDYDIKMGAFFINFMITLFALLATLTIAIAVVMIFHKRLICLFLVAILAYGLCHCGRIVVSALNQPKYTDLFNENHEMEENPLYLSGKDRTLAQTHLFVSPYAQVVYAGNTLLWEEKEEKRDNSLIYKTGRYHLEFFITDLLELVVFSLIGIIIFHRQELK